MNEPSSYSYSILVNKCSCNNINDLYAKLCVPDVIKNINIKVFNLMSRNNETRHVSWHETCTSKCRVDASVCNDKHHWINDKCRCECKELIDKGRCDKEFIWNLSNCKYECHKSCNVGEYLGYANCKCRKRLIDKLFEECSEDINGNEMIHNDTLNNHRKVCSSCTIYIVFLIITSITLMGIDVVFIYFYWHTIENCFNKVPC